MLALCLPSITYTHDYVCDGELLFVGAVSHSRLDARVIHAAWTDPKGTLHKLKSGHWPGLPQLLVRASAV